MKVINLFGGSGSGKSTTAAGLFYLMKTNNYNVELVTEVAKDYVWEQRTQCLKDQLYVTANQNHRLDRIKDKVDWAIMDSPLILNLSYMPKNYYKSFKNLSLELFESYDNINFFINRVNPYCEIGRLETEDESNKISLDIKNLLNKYDYKEINGDSDAIKKIFNEIKNHG